ncbi:hypothetical protein, partial [Sideroxydans sp. CL21]
ERNPAIPESAWRTTRYRYRRSDRHLAGQGTRSFDRARSQRRDHGVPFDQVRKGQKDRRYQLPPGRIHSSGSSRPKIQIPIEVVV